eukprot:CFRG8481T1
MSSMKISLKHIFKDYRKAKKPSQDKQILSFSASSLQKVTLSSRNSHSLGPTSPDIGNARILEVRYKLDYDTNSEGSPKSATEFRSILANGGTAPWAAVYGLRSKYFALTRDGTYGSSFYTFLTQKDLDDYLVSDLFKTESSLPHIVDTKIEVYEILPGSENTIDMGNWPSGHQGRPTRRDIEKTVILYSKSTLINNIGTHGWPTSPDALKRCLGKVMKNAAQWDGIPGLRSLCFTYNDKKKITGGIYTFQCHDSLNEYLVSDVRSYAVKGPHVNNEKFTIYEVISGTELTMNQIPWPQA